MANTIVNLGDLRRMVERYEGALKGVDAVSLNENGEPGDKANREDIDKCVQALEQVNFLLGKICQQPVLAVRLTNR